MTLQEIVDSLPWLSAKLRSAILAPNMTPVEFRDARLKLGETQYSLWRLLQVREQSIQRWETRKSRIPKVASIIVRRLLADLP